MRGGENMENTEVAVETGVVTGTEPEVVPSGLPSDVDTQTTFSVSDEDLTDGKFQGKWSNPQEMADYIKNIEDKHANLTREVADSSKQDDADIADMAKTSQAEQLKLDTVRDLAPEFLANGMNVTDEMKEALSKAGISEQEIKLGAYEVKEAIDTNASYVGGKENYDIIMNFHANNMTDNEKRQFNHTIQDPNNSEALMVGLQAIYERKSGDVDSAPQDRVRGNPAPTTIQPYESKRELLRDKKFADSRTASTADKARFRQRLNATSEDVWR